MNEFQTSAGSPNYPLPGGANLPTPGDRVKRARVSPQPRRHDLLHYAAIIAVGCLICVGAIWIIFRLTLAS